MSTGGIHRKLAPKGKNPPTVTRHHTRPNQSLWFLPLPRDGVNSECQGQGRGLCGDQPSVTAT